MGVRNKIRLSIVMIVLLMIGNAVGAFETITSSYVAPHIETEVGNLKVNKVYQLRYYPPGTLDCNSDPAVGTCNKELEADPDKSGYITTPYWTTQGPNLLTYSKSFTPKENGNWVIALFHAGLGDAKVPDPGNPDQYIYNPDKYVDSYKVCTKVIIPIPEFPTIALPIAAVMGLLFVFQIRKKKEE